MSEYRTNLVGRIGRLFQGNAANLVVLIMLGALILTAILVLPGMDLTQWLGEQGFDITIDW